MFTRFAAALALLLPFPCIVDAQSARVGLHFGANLSDGWDNERFGAQASVRISSVLEASGVFSVFSNYPDAPGFTGSAWQTNVIVRARPRGSWSFVSVGYGLSVLHQSVRNSSLQIDDSDTQVYDAAVVGLEAPTRYVRPFVDFYVLSLLESKNALGFDLLMGVQIPLASRRRN